MVSILHSMQKVLCNYLCCGNVCGKWQVHGCCPFSKGYTTIASTILLTVPYYWCWVRHCFCALAHKTYFGTQDVDDHAQKSSLRVLHTDLNTSLIDFPLFKWLVTISTYTSQWSTFQSMGLKRTWLLNPC